MWLFDDAKLVLNSLNFNDDIVRFFYIWNKANGMLVNAKKAYVFFWDCRANVRARQHHSSATTVREVSRSLCQQKVKMEHAHAM